MPTLNTLEIVLVATAANSKLAVLNVKTTKLKMTYFCVNKMICLASKLFFKWGFVSDFYVGLFISFLNFNLYRLAALIDYDMVTQLITFTVTFGQSVYRRGPLSLGVRRR